MLCIKIALAAVLSSVCGLADGSDNLAALQDTLRSARVAADRSPAGTSTVPLQAVSSTEIQRRGAAALSEVVRTFAGVSVKDYGGVGGLKTVSVRSFGAQHTAVMYDGFAVSDARSGQVDISRFDLENLSSVGMSISGDDDIFRSAKLLSAAGTLVLETARPVFDSCSTHVSARLRAGSFGTVSPYVLVQQKIATRWALSASGSYLRTDGAYPFTLVNGSNVTTERRLNSDVSSTSAEANLFGAIGAGELKAKLSWFGSERGLPGSVVLYTQHPSERLWDKDVTANVSYSLSRGAWKWRADAGYDWIWNRYLNTDAAYTTPEEDIYSQHTYSADGILQYSAGENLIFSLAQDLSYGTLDSNIPECQFPRRFNSVTALRAKWSSDRLTLVAGLSATYVHETVRSGEAAPDRSRLSPSLSASFRLTDALRLRASIRDGFRTPTFNDLYYARVGNTSLLPEKALQTNLGATWTRNALTLTADLYCNSVKDKIVAVPTMFVWKMRNVGKALMAGTDLTASWQGKPTPWLSAHLSASYSFQYAVDTTDPSAKNYLNQIPYAPRHSGNAVAGFETRWVDFSYTLVAVGRRWSLAQNLPSNEIGGYADHSVSLGHSFRFGSARPWTLRLSAEALNIGNVNYEVIKWYPMAGRNYRITIKISY